MEQPSELSSLNDGIKHPSHGQKYHSAIVTGKNHVRTVRFLHRAGLLLGLRFKTISVPFIYRRLHVNNFAVANKRLLINTDKSIYIGLPCRKPMYNYIHFDHHITHTLISSCFRHASCLQVQLRTCYVDCYVSYQYVRTTNKERRYSTVL